MRSSSLAKWAKKIAAFLRTTSVFSLITNIKSGIIASNSRTLSGNVTTKAEEPAQAFTKLLQASWLSSFLVYSKLSFNKNIASTEKESKRFLVSLCSSSHILEKPSTFITVCKILKAFNWSSPCLNSLLK